MKGDSCPLQKKGTGDLCERGGMGQESCKQRTRGVTDLLACLQLQPPEEDGVLVADHQSDPEDSPEPWGVLSRLLGRWPGRRIIKCDGSDYCK